MEGGAGAGDEDRKTTRRGDWIPPASKGDDKHYEQLPGDDDEGMTVKTCLKDVCRGIYDRVTVLHWLPHYNWKQDFFYDCVGGTTISLICLVQTLAHAAIATTDVIQGPYCAFVPPFAYAMLGTSPHASISSGAIAAILIADQLSHWPDIADRTVLASFLALISGLWLTVMGLCKAAHLVRFLSQSLISGFVTGGSVLILEGQVKNLLGLVNIKHGSGFVSNAVCIWNDIGETNYLGVALGVVMIIFLSTMNEVKKKTSAMLKDAKKKKETPKGWVKHAKTFSEMKELVLVGMCVAFAYFTQGANGPIVPVIGNIPPGLPPFKPSWDVPVVQELLHDRDRFQGFIVSGFLVALTSFLTTYATSKKQALAHGYHLDASQEMFALGMAGTLGSFWGAFTPSGSLSRTSLASEAGVRTQMSGLMNLGVIGLCLTYFTPVLWYLPKAALAAIIIRSTWNLVDYTTFLELWKAWKPYQQGGLKRDLFVWVLAFVATTFCGVLYGIGFACLVSLLILIKDAAMPRTVTLGQIESLGNIYRDVTVWKEAKTWTGILIVEFRGPLSFASADWFSEEIERKRLSSPHTVEIIVISFGSVHDLDKTAIEMLREVLVEWRKHHVSCIIADSKSRIRLLLEQYFAKMESGKVPLLDQPAFLINLEDAVQLAKRQLARKGRTISCYNARDDSAIKKGWRA